MKKKLSEMTLEELWQLFPIVLTEHRAEWAQWFAQERDMLAQLLPEAAISHVGSTAIDGIWAKPIVDILVETEDNADWEKIGRDLTAQGGYICMARSEQRMSFNKGYTPKGFAEKVFHLHLRRRGDNDELLFRDYLNAHPAEAKEYEQLKLALWKTYEHDRDGYTAQKADFVAACMEKASREAKVRVIYRAADMDASAPLIILVGENGERAESLAAAAKKAKLRCAVDVLPVEDWNRQLSPWPAKAVFRGGEDFAGEADAFFEAMMKALPEGKRLCLMGYSLAGLFALYVATRTQVFAKVAALSPSVWYPGFREYFAAHLPGGDTEFYLSLGRKEEKSGPALMRTVGDNLRAVQALLGGGTPLVMHDGGHYTDVEKRLLAAMEWICKDA